MRKLLNSIPPVRSIKRKTENRFVVGSDDNEEDGAESGIKESTWVALESYLIHSDYARFLVSCWLGLDILVGLKSLALDRRIEFLADSVIHPQEHQDT